VIGFLDLLWRRADGAGAAFSKGLAEGSYHLGQNVVLEFHWAEGQYGRFPELAADFVRRKVNVIVSLGSGAAALAAKAATNTIPIVFVALGLFATMAKSEPPPSPAGRALASGCAKRSPRHLGR
jgi:ABC-type uncharacterized transport system substrate-binding protein